MDILKLMEIREGGLYRLRVGERRVIYVAVTADRRAFVLVVDDREVGYKRLQVKAQERLRDLLGT
jgi:mRNA-degrading endonuclease RelE of RelBE toxin-antitoxin system